MPMKTMRALPVLLLTLVLVITSCAPMKATRGNFLDDDRLRSVQINVSTKEEVARRLGTPTTMDPFDKNIWFYIGEKTSTKAFFDPEIDARKIIKMTFNDHDILVNAEQVNEGAGQKVEPVTKQTPSPGKEMNAFEQFLSNIGKFNSSRNADGSTSRNQGR
ncbi:MAG: cell envelope protein SmpA [Alphaproteobacteria bacterium]|nr:cell envelope protein SmpA [Alphaproteobacteria bacterium]